MKFIVIYNRKCWKGLCIVWSEGYEIWFELRRERKRNGEGRSTISEGGIREARKGWRRDVRKGVQGKRKGHWEDRCPKEDSPPWGRRRCPSHHPPWGFNSADALSRSPCRQVSILSPLPTFLLFLSFLV